MTYMKTGDIVNVLQPDMLPDVIGVWFEQRQCVIDANGKIFNASLCITRPASESEIDNFANNLFLRSYSKPEKTI